MSKILQILMTLGEFRKYLSIYRQVVWSISYILEEKNEQYVEFFSETKRLKQFLGDLGSSDPELSKASLRAIGNLVVIFQAFYC